MKVVNHNNIIEYNRKKRKEKEKVMLEFLGIKEDKGGS